MTNLVDAIIRSLDEEPERWRTWSKGKSSSKNGVFLDSAVLCGVSITRRGTIDRPDDCSVTRNERQRLVAAIKRWDHWTGETSVNAALAALNGEKP